MLKGEYEKTYFSYLSRGRYSEQIERYLKYFDRDQILILSFEKDIKQNLKETVIKVQQFLNVQPIALDTSIQKLPSQTVRNNWMHRRLHGKSGLKSFAKRFISEKKRAKLRSKVTELNNKPLTQEDKLTETQKQEYLTAYFPDEAGLLKELVGLDFSYWNKETQV